MIRSTSISLIGGVQVRFDVAEGLGGSGSWRGLSPSPFLRLTLLVTPGSDSHRAVPQVPLPSTPSGIDHFLPSHLAPAALAGPGFSSGGSFSILFF
jgi:hypothetical protein